MSRPLSSHFLASSADRPALRIGLLIDGPSMSRASASVLRDLRAAGFAGIELVVHAPARAGATSPGSRPAGGRGARTRFGRLRAEGGAAYAIYATLDRRRTRTSDDPLDDEDVGPLLAGIPFVSVPPGRVASDVVDRVRAANLDVVVDLRVDGSERAPEVASRHGVWAIHHGDGLRYRAGPAGFRELLDGSPVCGVVLRRLADDDGAEVVLDRASFATDPASLARTRRTAWYGSTHLVIRNLRLLHERGWAWFAARRPSAPVAPPPAAAERPPSARDVIGWLLPLVARKVAARLVRAVTRSDAVLHWRIAIRIGAPRSLLDGAADLTGFRWVESPRGHYYADPFLVERQGRRWLFFEDYAYARDAAAIACAELGPGGELAAVRTVLESAGHLSYPLVVLDGAEALMIPESAADGVVRAYRATAFPDVWTIAAELLPEAAVDTSVWRRDGTWWLFTTVNEPRGGAGMLMLFHADALDGPWIPHPLNPISQDVRTNRGAGNLFLDGGRLIRPSQDGSRGYGYGITFNEITTLSETEYAERPGPAVTPDRVPGLLGLHTYNRVGDVEVIDGKVSRPRKSVA